MGAHTATIKSYTIGYHDCFTHGLIRSLTGVKSAVAIP